MSYQESSSMSKIPTHIMFDIFSRLSANTVGQSRCVCKTWCNLLSDPHFIDLHLHKSPSFLIINEDRFNKSTNIYLVEIDDEPDNHLFHREPARKWCLTERLCLVGSFNGLLCLWDPEDDDTYIANPILREYILLPKQKNVRRGFQAYISYGFGLCPTTNQYKVVRIFQGNVPDESPSGTSTYVSECEVYTLGTEAWRCVGHVSLISVGISPAVFLNGGFHWLNSELIGFDLHTESFKMVCSAPQPLNIEASYLSGGLAELGGCLCVSDNSLDTELVIWKMKEYGVKESWSKEFVIRKSCIPEWVGYEFVSPVKILKDGSILMLWRDDRLFTYCPRTKVFQGLDIGTLPTYDTVFQAMNYVPSILSLKNLLLEDVQLFLDLETGPVVSCSCPGSLCSC